MCPEPEVPETLNSYSHPGLPQLPAEPEVCPLHDSPPSFTCSLPKSGQDPHHIPVLNGIGPCCAFSSGPPFPLCHQFLPIFPGLTATSLIAQPGPLLPGKSSQTLELLVICKLACHCGLFHSLLVFSQCAVYLHYLPHHLDYWGKAQSPGRCQPSPHPDSISLNLGASTARRQPPAGERKPKGFSLPLAGEGET